MQPFRFAVIADTHLNQGEDECNSPFDVNRLANARMRYVVQELNTYDLDFVIHLGDLVHPVPAIPHLYERAVANFHDQVTELRHPLHVIPGNHDVGDKPVDWGPAGVVSDAFLALWEKHFGKDYYAFEHQGCHFVNLNAQIINSGLESEATQKDWLENYLNAHSSHRIFINIHYPPYLTYREEGEHYDNIGEPGRSWLLNLIERHGIEALFAGHVHNFWYHRHAQTDCYLLPSTAMVRQDYSEMYQAAPGADMQAGRNDAPKLGYFLVDVDEHGHACRVLRTYGRTVEPGKSPMVSANRVTPLLPRENWRAPLGFDMRQNWMAITEIPPSGGLDEFDRKPVRNDYPLMALWETGVRDLRIPARDIVDPVRRERLSVLRERHGLRFTLFSYGVPDENLGSLLMQAPGLVDAWEIAARFEDLEVVAGAVQPITSKAGMRLFLSKLRSKEELEGGGEKYYHMINHGFTAEDTEQVREVSAFSGVDGVVFRVASTMSAWETVLAAGDLCEELNIDGSLHLRMSAANPADALHDDLWTANRIAEALTAAVACANIRVFADTFADSDRGYFVRNGIVDRLYNPRLGFHVVRHLYGALNARDETLEAHGVVPIDGGKVVCVRSKRRNVILVLPNQPVSHLTLPREWSEGLSAMRRIDLVNGEIAAAPKFDEEGTLSFPNAAIHVPTFFDVERSY